MLQVDSEKSTSYSLSLSLSPALLFHVAKTLAQTLFDSSFSSCSSSSGFSSFQWIFVYMMIIVFQYFQLNQLVSCCVAAIFAEN